MKSKKDPAPFVCERCHKTTANRSLDPTTRVNRYDGLSQTHIHNAPRLVCATCKGELRAEALKREGKPPEPKRRASAKDTLTIPMFDEADMLPRRAQ